MFKINDFKRVDYGNFFFKKSFYRTLIKSRTVLKDFFFLNDKVRQKKISKKILNDQKQFKSKDITYEYSILNIVLRSHFCLCLSDALLFIKGGFFSLNGVCINKTNLVIVKHDCLQLKLSNSILSFLKKSKKILKRKTALVRYNTWKFYKQKYFKKLEQLKPKKRKIPKYIYLFYLYKLNVPKFLEIDYTSLSIFVLNKKNDYKPTSYYLNKFFSFKLFPLYNFKKIN